MAKALFGSAELKIKYPSDLWFLHPSKPPTHDTVINGTVILSLPNTRKVKKLDVELVSQHRRRLLYHMLTARFCRSDDRTCTY